MTARHLAAREQEPVRGLRKVGRGFEAKGFEERSRASAARAQAKFRKALTGIENHAIQERAAHALLPVRRQHIKPPDAPDPGGRDVGVEIQAAKRNDAFLLASEIQGLSCSMESIEAVLPFFAKAAQVVPALGNALGEEELKPPQRQLARRIDVESQAHRPSSRPERVVRP